MGRKHTIDDELFGHLTHCAGYLWKRPIALHILGKLCTVDLMVDIDLRDGIEQYQVLAYKTFADNTRQVVAASEAAIPYTADPDFPMSTSCHDEMCTSWLRRNA